MVTMEQFQKELREKLGGDVSPNGNCCPHYRYYLPSDAECPYETHPQRLFWMCERDFHQVYGCHDVCRSYLDLWAEWESNRDWVGPEQYVDEPVADRLLAFWLMDDYDRYCPDGEFDLKAYFTLDNRGGRPCQDFAGILRGQAPEKRTPAWVLYLICLGGSANPGRNYGIIAA